MSAPITPNNHSRIASRKISESPNKSNDLESNLPKNKIHTTIKFLLCITYPFWGTVLFLALGCTLNLKLLFLIIGVFVGLFSPYPIWEDEDLEFISKLFFTLLYYLVSAFVMFFVGWFSICVFCYQCRY